MNISFRPRPSRSLILTATAALLLGTALTIWLWPKNDSGAPAKVVANNYSNRPSACLAADDSATSAQTVQRAWTVLQQAGKNNQVNVQQLVVPAKDAAEAAPYLSGLIAQRCALIVTVGTPFDGALPAAKNAPDVRFLAIDPPAGTNLEGATALTTGQIPKLLDQNVHDLAAEH